MVSCSGVMHITICACNVTLVHTCCVTVVYACYVTWPVMLSWYTPVILPGTRLLCYRGTCYNASPIHVIMRPGVCLQCYPDTCL